LLESVEANGIGNWEDIAKSLNVELGATNANHPLYKSPSAVQEHYEAVFLHGSMGKHMWQEERRGRALDHTGSAAGTTVSPVKSELCGDSNLTSHELILLGYLPIRNDFEVEFDNEAETLISHLVHQPISASASNNTQNSVNDEPDEALEAELQAAQVEMYRSKLRQRERRKKVAGNHQLIRQFFRENPISYDQRGHAMLSAPKLKKQSRSSSSSKGLTSPEAAEKLKLLAEFQTVPEFQAYMANINKEKEIRSRIKDLIRYRKNGIRKLADTAEFESQLKVRKINKKAQKRKAAVVVARAGRSLLGRDNPVSSGDASSVASPALGEAGSPLSIKALVIESIQSPGNSTPVVANPFSLNSYPGYDILSANEKKLCTNLCLKPSHYITYKTCLLTNHLQKKNGETPRPLQPVGLNKISEKIILDFLMRAGWITAYWSNGLEEGNAGKVGNTQKGICSKGR